MKKLWSVFRPNYTVEERNGHRVLRLRDGRLLPIPAGGADMTTTTMATWTPAVWSAKPTVTYRSNVVNVKLLDHTWEPELGVGRGNIVNIAGFTQNNSAKNRGAGTGTFGTGASMTYDAVTESQLQLTVNRLYYKAFRMPKEAQAQVMPSYIPMLLKGHGEAIALQVDADIAGDNTNGFDAFTATVGTDNVDLTEDDVLTADLDLNNENAGVNERFAVCSPASINSLRKIEAFRNSLYASVMGSIPADKGAGYISKIATFDLYMSNDLEAGTAGKKNAFFHREAIAYAEQIGVTADHQINQEDGLFDQYMSYMTCGFRMIKNAFGVEMAGK